MKFKFLEHTADVKFQAFGKNLNQIFVNSALAFKEAICGKTRIKSRIRKEIAVDGRDYVTLLHNFLEEILYLLEGENFILSKIKDIDVNGIRLIAVLAGDEFSNYKFTNPVKAVTYNEMFIRNEEKRWISQVVLDV